MVMLVYTRSFPITISCVERTWDALMRRVPCSTQFKIYYKSYCKAYLSAMIYGVVVGFVGSMARWMALEVYSYLIPSLPHSTTRILLKLFRIRAGMVLGSWRYLLMVLLATHLVTLVVLPVLAYNLADVVLRPYHALRGFSLPVLI